MSQDIGYQVLLVQFFFQNVQQLVNTDHVFGRSDVEMVRVVHVLEQFSSNRSNEYSLDHGFSKIYTYCL